ncbi:MAG: Cytochrome c oxidase (cbb3-type) subunit CcoP [Rhodanobacteraceae bacterium]|jgi:cytochrome c oxidase cbb3-type subunit 3|nr:MAG: Cytochrome c oxidase (cbb3-type) subunit CcoP [Rhodanobacteraceae bacterium]
MSTFWSIWVMALVVFNLGLTFVLFLWAPRAKVPVKPDGTTGHVWAHGVLREGLNNLPRWWIALSGAMFIAAFIYLWLYPGFGAHKGKLGWTAHGQLAQEVAENNAKLDPLLARFRMYTVEQLSGDQQALQMGKVLFEDNCAACHGRNAKGNMALGAPNLTDNDWLYGGTGKDITASITNGRAGVMPAWNALGEDTVNNLVEYVLQISGQPHDAKMAAAAEPTFKSTCAACHGADGKGNQGVGAPNLTDAIWLHGGTRADIHTTIHDGRQGAMPAWHSRLSDDDIHVTAAYVYSLSHREDGSTP